MNKKIISAFLTAAALFSFSAVFSGCGGGDASSGLLKDAYKDYFPIGAALNKYAIANYDEDLLPHFNSLTADSDMKWEYVHPDAGRYTYSARDELVIPVFPATSSAEDIKACDGSDSHANRWFLDPIFKKSYPDEGLRLYSKYIKDWDFIKDGDFDVTSEPCDFLGINYYQSMLIKADGNAEYGFSGADSGAKKTDYGWYVTPEALGKLVKRLRGEYTRFYIDTVNTTPTVAGDLTFTQIRLTEDEPDDMPEDDIPGIELTDTLEIEKVKADAVLTLDITSKNSFTLSHGTNIGTGWSHAIINYPTYRITGKTALTMTVKNNGAGIAYLRTDLQTEQNGGGTKILEYNFTLEPGETRRIIIDFSSKTGTANSIIFFYDSMMVAQPLAGSITVTEIAFWDAAPVPGGTLTFVTEVHPSYTTVTTGDTFTISHTQPLTWSATEITFPTYNAFGMDTITFKVTNNNSSLAADVRVDVGSVKKTFTVAAGATETITFTFSGTAAKIVVFLNSMQDDLTGTAEGSVTFFDVKFSDSLAPVEPEEPDPEDPVTLAFNMADHGDYPGSTTEGNSVTIKHTKSLGNWAACYDLPFVNGFDATDLNMISFSITNNHAEYSATIRLDILTTNGTKTIELPSIAAGETADFEYSFADKGVATGLGVFLNSAQSGLGVPAGNITIFDIELFTA